MSVQLYNSPFRSWSSGLSAASSAASCLQSPTAAAFCPSCLWHHHTQHHRMPSLFLSTQRNNVCVYVGGAGKAHSNQEGDRDKTTELHPPICGGTLCLLLGLWPHCPPLRTPGECFITMATGKPPSPTGGVCLGSWEQAECQEPLFLRSELEYRWNDCWLWTVHWNTRVFCCLVSSWDLAKTPFHNHNHVCVNCFENCL